MPPIKLTYKKEFPLLLRQLEKVRPFLSIIGEWPPDTHAWLCVIGSRAHSAYGAEVCRKLIEGLQGYPVVIVSGLAVGIDSLAHEIALSVGLKTVAVPGSGLDEKVLYPQSHLDLAKKIVASGGAIVSPFKSEQEGTKWTFPVRNELMAGLSQAILVIEGRKKSGTIITSSAAGKISRDLLAVPGSIFSDLSEGPNEMIRDGATAVTSSRDILEALGFEVLEEKESNSEKIEKLLNNPSLSSDEKSLIRLLSNPRVRDDLIRKSGLNTARLNTLLVSLEMKGFVSEDAGIFYIKK